jgi:hypothetical protein
VSFILQEIEIDQKTDERKEEKKKRKEQKRQKDSSDLVRADVYRLPSERVGACRVHA